MFTRELTLVVRASRVLGVCGLLPHAIMEFYIIGSDVGHSSLRLSRPPYLSWRQTEGVSCTERGERDMERHTVGEGHACGRGHIAPAGEGLVGSP